MARAEAEAGMRRPIDEQTAQLLEEQKRSGLSIAAFAKTRGVPAWKLYQAGKARKRSRRAEFVEVAVKSEGATAAPLEIVAPGGLRVRVPRDFDEATLRRVLQALTSC